jgi:2-dehydro-3-deoxygalactonokinase
LFQVRSRQLIEGLSADRATSLLSGLLLAADVDSAQRLLRPESVTLICEPSLAELYAQALRARGIESQRLDGSECILAALRALADA